MSLIYPVILKISDHCLADVDLDPLTVQSEVARNALQFSARLADLPLGPIQKDDKGAPFSVNGVHLSLSHTSFFAAGIIACSPIGIDLEKIVSFSNFLKNRVATESEWKLFSEVTPIAFYRLWTAKEAVLKAAGIGIAGLPECEVTELFGDQGMTLTMFGKVWQAEHHLFQDHIASVASSGGVGGAIWHFQ
jgi:4'-phosphopantetheinyl transferase